MLPLVYRRRDHERSKNMKHLFCVTLLLGLSVQALAQRAGNHSFGFSLSLTGPNQKDVNSWVNSLNTVGTKELSSGYEVIADYQYRFSRTIFALLFRPSFLSQSASGGGVASSLSSFTFFPMFRLYPLENSFIQLFLQVGVGYGNASLKLENGSTAGTFSNSAFGALAGLGVNFCFTANHCAVIEGNFRYLPIERLEGNASGALGGNITQSNGELEKNNVDLGVTLTGVQGIIGYRFNF
jgi:opacity protein-like surface antigen